MPYNFIANSFHTKKLCSRLSSSEVRFYTENGRSIINRAKFQLDRLRGFGDPGGRKSLPPID